MPVQTHCAFVATLLVSFITLVPQVHAGSVSGEGTTRTDASNQTYWVEQVTEGLTFPSSMVWLPNGDMLITERMGSLRIVRGDELDPRVVDGTPASYHGLWDGLRDILLDPEYQSNQALYLLISEGTFDQRHAAVYRAHYSGDGLKGVTRIFRTKDDIGGYSMFVTRMIFLADKSLLIAIAEDHQDRAQQLDSHMGKILRIKRDGSIPEDNPFLTTPGALPEIWSYGHRAPLGLYQDGETGVIWEIESGPRGGDELNILRPGGNYGWAKASWGFSYNNNGLDAPLQSGPGIEDPILVWTPSVTPSGLTRYRGKMYPMWHGDFFLGHMTNRALERLRIRDNRVVLQERMLLDLEERIRDVKIGPDQHLYLLTDHQNGRLFRLRPGRPRTQERDLVARKLDETFSAQRALDFPTDSDDAISNMQPSDILNGRQAFLERCAGCHSIGTAVRGGEGGPDLTDIYGSLMGRKAGFVYSENMAGSVFAWKFATLNKFLTSPDGFVPGTKMISAPVTDPKTRRDIIGFLKQQSLK